MYFSLLEGEEGKAQVLLNQGISGEPALMHISFAPKSGKSRWWLNEKVEISEHPEKQQVNILFRQFLIVL